MTNTINPKHSLTINIDKEQILNIIYAESAWHCIVHPEAKRLTPDVERACMLRVKEGFDDMRSRFQAYIHFANFNPNTERKNVTLEFRFFNPYPDSLPDILGNDVTQLLAWFALKRFYGDDASYYHTAWLKHRAGIAIAFARDANYHLLQEPRDKSLTL